MSRDNEIAWAAGLFEGEGTVGTRVSNSNEMIRFSLKNTDEDVVRRFADVMGAGNVRGPYLNPPHKPLWSWEAAARQDVFLVSRLLAPYLGERRTNALERAWHRYSNNESVRAMRTKNYLLLEKAAA